jgi:SNF2 family DNA or RNA helicase
MAAGNAEQFDGNETVDKALEKLGLATQYQLLPGMEVALMAHQVRFARCLLSIGIDLSREYLQTIGVAWMLDKEKNKAYMGGCLSDEMGLGKVCSQMSCLCP